MGNTDAIRGPAHAKLNLFLHVQEARKDGFHNLESLVAFAELHDVISIEKADRLELLRTGPFATEVDVEPKQDLIIRAALALGRLAGIEPKVRISLTKNIPVSAGLGGGSSDAAATIKLLSQYWDISINQTNIMSLALSLGADVPACIHGKEALIRGVGDTIIPASLPKKKLAVVFVKPKESLSTSSVFKFFTGPFVKECSQRLKFTNIGSLAAYLSGKKNSLTSPAEILCSDIKTALAGLKESQGCYLSRLSGSGPTCFGLFLNQKMAHASASKISRDHPNWWVMETFISGNYEDTSRCVGH